ncbi:MAG: hypothetical protein M3502_01070 [Actinomycetota bacterium]|nr:hypothetical protein [Actinomycetota bacterium]
MQGRIFLAAAMALASAVFVAPAAAHQASSVDARIDQALAGARPGQFVQVKPFGPTRRASDGLLEIRLAGGQVVKTHGLDPEPPVTAADAAAGGAHPERGLNCADLPRLQVLYVHPSDRPNRFSKSMYERIRTYMRRMSHRLNADALSSSQGRIGADYRVRCKSSGKIDIRALETRTTAARDDWSIIQADLKRAGHDSRQGKYLVWYDDPVERGCGLANFRRDDSKSATNANNGGPLYSVVWGNTATRTCWGWYIGMHENAHNMGAVQYSAPKSSGDKGHCNDGLDVLCYADGGNKSAYTDSRCTLRIFDCGKDTYFDTLTEPREWLRHRWNLGWSGNRFLDFPRPDQAAPPDLTPSGG